MQIILLLSTWLMLIQEVAFTTTAPSSSATTRETSTTSVTIEPTIPFSPTETTSEDEPTHPCLKNEGVSFVCNHPTVCIPWLWRCDGEQDCADGSDEEGCEEIECAEHDMFKCLDSSLCIQKAWVCDGSNDCTDGSDESQDVCGDLSTTLGPHPHLDEGTKSLCNESFQTECKNEGFCIPALWRCDGEEDCSDGSDESHCAPSTTNASDTLGPAANGTRLPQGSCAEGSVQCFHGQDCIHSGRVCDGQEDCDDGSDEIFCPDGPSTPGTSLGSTKTADIGILHYFALDGKLVAVDLNSNKSGPHLPQGDCIDRFVQCPEGRCILKKFVCDGGDDCFLGADEINCEGFIPDVIRDQFGPEESSAEVSMESADQSPVWNSSQISCSNPMFHSNNSFECGDGTCIWWTWVQDGEKDCANGADEVEPNPFACSNATLIRCANGQCIDRAQVCDSQMDCEDSSDEKFCAVCKKAGMFTCDAAPRACVRQSQRCDGVDHCPDGSDEFGCGPARGRCQLGHQIQCRDSEMCIHKSDWCDGWQGCPDGADEDQETCNRYRCGNRFYCPRSRRCVDRDKVCDGLIDCWHGEDESDCAQGLTLTSCDVVHQSNRAHFQQGTCAANRLQCNETGVCVGSEQLCDCNQDCLDGSDEANCVLFSSATPGGSSEHLVPGFAAAKEGPKSPIRRLEISTFGSSSITLKWHLLNRTDPSPPLQEQIWYAAVENGRWRSTGWMRNRNNSYTITQLVPDTLYNITVRMKHIRRASFFVRRLTYYTTDTFVQQRTRLPPVQGLALSHEGKAGGILRLTWNVPDGVKLPISYQIEEASTASLWRTSPTNQTEFSIIDYQNNLSLGTRDVDSRLVFSVHALNLNASDQLGEKSDLVHFDLRTIF